MKVWTATHERRTEFIFVAFVACTALVYVAFVGNISPGFMSYAVAGLLLAHLYWFRSWKDIVAVILSTTALCFVYFIRHPMHLFVLLPIAGISSGLVLCARWAFAREAERSFVEEVVAPPVLIAIFSNVSEVPQLLTVFYQNTLDANLLRLDSLAGFQPSFALGSVVLSHRFSAVFVRAWYDALGLGLIAVLVPLCHDRAKMKSLITALVISGLAGFLLYNIVPAVGPVYAVDGYPRMLSSVSQPARTVRNCFPSLHMTWALLMLLYARTKWTRLLAAAFVVMTAIATLGLGEHYAADLIVAVPFTAMVFTLETQRRITRQFLASAFMVALLTACALTPSAIPVFILRIVPVVALASAAFTIAASTKLNVSIRVLREDHNPLTTTTTSYVPPVIEPV